MARIEASGKPCVVNPLKVSPPLGAAMAFMGLDGCIPMLHAAQGCTAFALVLLVRHFREAIPLQTTAMNEVSTILGGSDNLQQAILNVAQRAHPKVIGICSTGLTETRGEDIRGDLKLVRRRHSELADVALIHAATSDYKGGLEDGWGAAVTAIVEALVEPTPARDPRQINVLAGSHLTPADLEEIRDTIEAFGLTPIMLPDLAGSLDGHVADRYVPTTLGGTSLDDVRAMGASAVTLALGLQVEPAARLLESRCGVPVETFPQLVGLRAWDDFVSALSRRSGEPAPSRVRRRRSQLVDAMLDGHFYFGGKRIAIAAEPDLLLGLSQFLADMGATIACAVATTHAAALTPIMLPDLAGSLDGHVADRYVPTTLGGTSLDDVRAMGASAVTLALGLQVEPAARLLESRCGVPVETFPQLVGLRAWDDFVSALSRRSGEPAPSRVRRRRSQLVDAMLDGHFYFGGKRIAIAAEPDLLLGLSQFLADMGATIACAVAATHAAALTQAPAESVTIGDLDDLERRAAGCDLVVSHAHGRRIAERLDIPFFPAGFPLFDTLGAAHRLSVGYRGSRDLIFAIGNLFIANQGDHGGRDRQGGRHAAVAAH